MYLMQTDQVKKFNFSKNKIFLIIFCIIIISFTSFLIIKPKNQTKNYKQTQYAEIIQEINAKNNANFIHVEKFIIENENIYGTLAALSLAKQYILKNNLEKAFIQLKTSLKYTKEENLKNILRLRMSQIKMQQKKNKDAMQIIEEIKDYAWKSIVENIKGDIFMKNGNIRLAIQSWEKSKYFEESKTFKEIINMKINEAQKK